MLAKLKSALVLATLCVSTSAMAHSFWVDERTGQLAIIFGESGDDARYDADVVESVRGLTNDGKTVAVTTVATANNVLLEVPDGVQTLITKFHPKYYSKDANNEWHTKPKNLVENVVNATVYHHSNITPLDNQKKPMRFVELPLQILPLSDPFGLKVGDTLQVQVYFDGKPLANAKVSQNYANNPDDVVLTNQNGIANVHIKSAGLTVLRTYHEVDNSDKTLADSTLYNATLSFNLFNHKYK